MAHLQVRELSKSFGGAPVLEGVTLEVQPGELLAILGASGSGKTTLLRLICGFERADGGTIEIDGRIVADARTRLLPEQRRVGYVAQEGALFPHLSVADNIVFGLSRWQRRKRYRVAELLEFVGLPAIFADRPPQALSGGEQQRVALARAIVSEPKIVLADEPTGNLDTKSSEAVLNLLRDLNKDLGQTIVMITHNPEAAAYGHRVLHMRDGEVVDGASVH